MPGPVGVLNHPQRSKIDRMILDGIGDRTIAKTVDPPLNRSTVLRYRRTVVRNSVQPVAAVTKVLRDNGLLAPDASPEKIQAAVVKSAEGLAAASPFLARLAQFDKYESFGFEQAVENKKPSEIAMLLNAATKRVELAASLSGVLSTPGGAHVQVDARSLTVVVPNGKR